jgi:hypothetical protein
MIEGQLEGLMYSLVLTSYHGVLKSNTMSKSSIEAEYKAIADATAEIMWVHTHLRELNILTPKAARLWCYNIGAKYLSANPIFHGRSKHIEVDYHFVQK